MENLKLSEYVKMVRNKLVLTQEQFGRLINKKRYVIADYETSRSEPPGNVLLKIQALEQKHAAELIRGQCVSDTQLQSK